MSLGIKRFCEHSDRRDCVHCVGWEVDGVGDVGEHTIWFEYECTCPCESCAYVKKSESNHSNA